MRTFLIGLFLLAALPGLLQAMPPGGAEISRECTYGDCEDGFGILQIRTEFGTDEYEGNFQDGEFHGYGTLTRLVSFNHRSYYDGQWRNGVRHGRGTYWDGRANLYIGEWRDDLRHGQGSYFFGLEDWSPNRYSEHWLSQNTENYTGQFVDDLYQGRGVFRWPDGRRYEGEFYANERHGRGTFYYPTGTVRPQVWEYGRLQR